MSPTDEPDLAAKDRFRWRSILPQILSVAIVLALIGGSLWWFLVRESPERPAPDFSLVDLDGEAFNLSDYRGQQVVILDFWALWCTFCTILAEETLQPLQDEYATELVVLAINTDPTDSDEDQQEYRTDHGFTFRYAPDTDEVALKYRVVDLPRLVVIDLDGYATFAGLGVASLSHSTVSRAVEDALAGESDPIVITSLSLIPLALLAGVFFFFSPCAFPLLPGYMSFYLSQESEGLAPGATSVFDRTRLRKALSAGVASASGLALTNLIIAGIILSAASLVKPYLALLSPLMGVIIIILGLAMLSDLQFYWLVRPFQRLADILARPFQRSRSSEDGEAGPSGGLRGLFLYGVGYGGAASGCCAPIFIMLLLLATTQGLAMGLLVMTLYTLTGALLMIAVTVATAASQRTLLERLKASTRHITVASGILLVVVGVYLLWSYYRAFGIATPF